MLTAAPLAQAQTSDILVGKSALEGSYIPGQSVTYTISVFNAGPDPVSGLTINDVFAPEVAAYVYNVQTLVNASVVSGGSGQGNAQPGSPGTLSAVVDIDAGGLVELVINAVVRISINGVPVTTDPLDNTASVVLPVGVTDPNPLDNSSTVGLTPNGPGGTGVGFTLCANLPGVIPRSITTANTVMNTYFTPSTNSAVTTLTVGQRCLPTDGVAGIGATPTALASLTVGQKLLVMQMQDGGSMNTSNSSSYGTGIGNAGAYEYVEVRGTVGSFGCGTNEIPITGASGSPGLGLMNAYSHDPAAIPKQVTQYVRAPQHTDITLSGTGTIAALPWDGLRGGVIAAEASGTFDLGSNPIGADASCSGFRGGGRLSQAVASPINRGPAAFRRMIAIGNGVKGEGLSGTPRLVFNGTSVVDLGGADGYLNGATGKGAPGSAGGGGNACVFVTGGPPPNVETGGGGGGGNGGRGGSGGTCNSNAATGAGAADTGGVQGRVFAGFTFNGVTFTSDTEDPTAVGRVTMGSGGGASAGNGSAGIEGSGGLGGGIILLSANQFIGTADVVSNGCDGQPAGANAGGGGGGAGGTVVLLTNLSGTTTYSGIEARVVGGAGGAAGNGNSNADLRGPGGGGGAGRTYISRIAAGGSAATTTSGGPAGVTDFTPDALQAQSYNASVGNNFVEQNSLNAYNSVPGAKPNFICSGGTVPVTLSDVSATVDGNELVVNFGTASEAGTLGFRVFQNQLGNREFALNQGKLTIAAGASSAPQRYEVRGVNRGAREVWIEEIQTTGKSALYGPYPVDLQIGERDIATLTNWSSIRAEQQAFRDFEAQSIRARLSGASALVELKVDADGWYQVSHDQLLAAGADFSGVASNQLRLQRGNDVIEQEVGGGATFGAGSTLKFYAESVKNSLYTNRAVYTLSAAPGAAQRSVFANPGNLSPSTSYLRQLKFEPNRKYSFSSPTNDPWYATRVIRSSTSPGLATETINVSDRVAASNDRLTLQLWGGTDFPEITADHSLAVSVNGVQVATASFDGIVAHEINVALPDGLLSNGDNLVDVQLTPNEASADVVYIESISFSYQRTLKVETDGQLMFAPLESGQSSDRMFADDFSNEGVSGCSSDEAGCAAYRVELTAPDARAFKISNGRALALSDSKITSSAGVFYLEFAQIAGPEDRFLVTQTTRAAAINLATVDSELLSGAGIDYLIITHPSFVSDLSALVLARQAQGLTVKVVNVESLYRAFSAGEFNPAAISSYLVAARQAWPSLKYVLLVGGDTYDYNNYLGTGSISFVPTLYRQTHEVVHYAPVDQVFADLNDDGRPELSIGRLPVRTTTELRNLVDKTLAYNNPTSSGTLLWVNDRDSNGYPFSGKSNEFAQMFPSWVVSRLDLNTYPVGQTANARNYLVDQINSGRSLIGFYGHSSPSNWTRESLLTSAQINQGTLLSNAQLPTAVVQFGCWGAYFVDPIYTSMAQELLLNTDGAALVIGASGLTDVNNNETMANALLPRLNGGISFGKANQQSASAIRGSHPDAVDIWLGSSVLGDPALVPND